MNYNHFRYILQVLFLFPWLLMTSQNNALHIRHVIEKNETWSSGRIDDERHVLDSFFYDNGNLKEVTKSLISRMRFNVIDSFTVDRREVWSSTGDLILIEHFKNKKIVNIECNYPENINIIKNGSFEEHSVIPVHVLYKGYELVINKPDKNSELKQWSDLVEKKVAPNDTVEKYIVQKTFYGNRKETPKEVHRDVHIRYMLIKRNSHQVIDSIYLESNIVYLTPNRIYRNPITSNERCNYDSIDIEVPGWNSIGRKYPLVFDYHQKAPWHPLIYIADQLSEFNVKTGNNFVKLVWGRHLWRNCCPSLSHLLLRSKLQTTLQKGEMYYLEFWFWKLRYTSKDYGGGFKVHFSQEPITHSNFELYKDKGIEIEQFNDTIKGRWCKASIYFEAPEFARYMTIGFFDLMSDNSNIPKKREDENNDCLPDYYNPSVYLDDFILVKEKFKNIVTPLFFANEDYLSDVNINTMFRYKGEMISVGDNIILNKIFFNLDSYVLLESSYTELNELLSFFKTNNSVTIRIEGHTDNIGDKTYNMRLSENRAQAVYSYLIKNGINRNKLSWKGYGNTKPLISNDDIIEQAKNRRVEFRIISSH